MPILYTTTRSGSRAELLVAYRFLEAGRVVSWPLTVCGYDLIVDGGDSLYRIQVKSTPPTMAEGATAYRYVCRLSKKDHDPLPAGTFDFLCMVVDPSRVYVIPAGALRCPHAPERLVKRVVLYEKGTRFAAYCNRFDLGSGELPCLAAVHPLRPPTRTMWKAAKTGQVGRKPHRRLSKADVETLRTLPIAFYQTDPGLPIAEVAQQYGVTVVTLRNLLRNKRLDLRPS